MDTTFNCDLCGAQHFITEAYDMEGLLICPDCLRQETEICQHCGTRIWRGDNAGDVVTPLCQSCYDMYYTRCSDCNEVIYESEAYYLDDDEDTPYCAQCAEGCRRSSGIHAYSYKPNPIFRGEGTRFFGVEPEIDEGGEDEGNARELLKLADSEEDELIYCKNDGSLSEGFEIVSHPFTLNFHTRCFRGRRFCIVLRRWAIYPIVRIRQDCISMSNGLPSAIRKWCRTEALQGFCIL